MVARAARAGTDEGRAALAWLFEVYAYPLYAFARRRGASPQDAEDAVQELFATLAAKGALASADPRRGRFRAYLLGAFEHRLSNRRRFLRALRRGAGRPVVSLDAADAEQRYALEPVDARSPQRLYEAAWARTLIERAFAALRAEYARGGKQALFERLRSLLIEGGEQGYRELAAELGLTEGALKVAVHRLRKRFRAALEAEIAETVEGPAEVQDEIRHLFEALGD